MQSKNHTTHGLFREMNSKKIKSPQIERISSLDSGRPPVMIFTSRGKVARKSINSRVFEAFEENGLRAQFENDNLKEKFDQETAGHNRHINGNIATQSDNTASFSSSAETTAKLRRPAPPVPVSNQRAPANGNPLVSSRAISSSLQSLNNRHSLESDRKVQPPLIAAPKSFLQRQSSLSSSTSSLSSLHASPTSQLQQPAMTKRQYALDLSLPPPPPDANNNNSDDIFQADVAYEEHQLISHSASTKKTRAPEPPALPSPPPPLSPPPPPSPPPHTPPLSPVLSQPSSLSSSSASSSPLKSFRFPPPPSTPPSPIENPETHTSFTSTSTTSAVLPWQSDSDKDRKNTLSPNEVMDYFDEAIGHPAVSASSYSDVSSYPAFSPVFHFPSVSDDKQIEPMPPAIESSTQISRDVGNMAESTETATAVSTVYYSKDINGEGNNAIPQAQLSHSESKTSEGNSTQSQGDNSFLSPKSEEERKKRAVAVSRLRPDVKTVRQYIKRGTVDELANLFSNMKDELIISPSNKSEFDFDLRDTLHKLESLDKGAENKSPVMRNAKRSTILSPNELFPRIQGSVSAESLQGRPRSQHSPAYTKVNQWPRLYQTSSANSLYTPAILPEPADTPRFDFLAASREIHKHVVLIRSNSRAGVTATNKGNDMKHDSSKIVDNVSNFVDNTPSSINESLISSQTLNNLSTEDTAETYHTGETYKTSQDNMSATTMSTSTEANKKDIGHIDPALITSELLKDQADSFDATAEFPHPTITPANSNSSSRRSSLDDHRKTETENFAVAVSLNEALTFSEVNGLASSQRSSRSNSPDRPISSQRSSRRSSLDDTGKKEDTSNNAASVDVEGTLLSYVSGRPTSSRGSSRSKSPDRHTNSRSSSRRSSFEDKRKKEDTSNYSADVDLEGTLSSVVARRHTSSRGSSRSNSPDRKSDFNRTLVLTASVNGSSRSNSIKSENNGELTSHKLNSSSGSQASNSPANSQNSSRAGSVRRSGEADAEITEYRSFDIENDLASKPTASFSPSNDANVETTEILNRKISMDDHSNVTSGGFVSYSENMSSFDSHTIKTEHIIVDSHIGISEDYKNTAVFTNPSIHSSRSSSISGSLKIKDNDEINLELPHSTLDTVAMGTVSPTSSGTSSRSSSPEKRRQDIPATLHTADIVFSQRDSISSSSRRSSQSEGEGMNYSKPISGDYENIALLDFTSHTSGRNSGFLNNRSNQDEVSLQLPSSFVGTVAVEAGAVSAVSHAGSKSSSRSSSPDRNNGSGDILQPSDSRTSVISTPERSRRSSQAEVERVDFYQITNEHHEHATVLATASGSISSRSTSRSGSVKIRDDTDTVHLEFPSPTEETVDLGIAAVYARNLSSRSSSGSSSPDRKVSSEDIIQSFEKAFVDRRASIPSTHDSSRKNSLTSLTTGDGESVTYIETNLTHLDGARTEWAGFRKTDSKHEEGNTAVFRVDVENKNIERANISAGSSKSSSRKGSLDRNNIHGGETMDLKTASLTPSSSRRSSIAGPVLKVSDESEYFNTALENSLGFTVKSAASSTSRSSRSSSMNQDDKQDQEETTHDHVFFSTAFHSNNRTDDEKDDLEDRLLKGNYTIEPVTSASSSRSDSPTKNESLEILQKDSHDKDVENLPISSSTTPIVSQKGSRESSPVRDTASVEHSLYHTEVYENITTSALTVTESPTSSIRSSHTNSVAGDFQLGQEKNESHMMYKKSTSSSNSPASSRRSSSSLGVESTIANQQITDDKTDVNIRKPEDIDTVRGVDWSSELKSQTPEEVSRTSVDILNSGNINTGTLTVSSGISSQTTYLHDDESENREDDTALLISKSSSSFTTTSPAGSRRMSRDVDSVRLDQYKSGSDPTTAGSIDAGSVTDIHVRTRSRDSSPNGSLKRMETWDHQETDSYQLALQSALESTLMTSPTTSSRRGSQGSFVKRGRETSHSSSISSKNSSRPESPTRTRDWNVNTLGTLAVSSSVFSHSSTNETNNITSMTFTKPGQGVDDAYSTSLSNIEYLGTVSTSVTEDTNYTLKDEDVNYTLKGEDATVYEFTDTHRTQETPTKTHVNTADGKHFNMYYTEVGSKLLEDKELKETSSSETFLPAPQGNILTSNFGSNVNFSENENISSVDSMFHLARLNSNKVVHSEVSQSMNGDRVVSSFSASMDMYSQPHVTAYSDQVASVSYEKNNDDSRDDSNPLLDTDDIPAVEYGHTVVDIHAHDKEDSMSQISTLSQFGSDKVMAGDTLDYGSDSSDSDNSSNQRSVQDGYTVNEASDENSSAFPIKANVYSFTDFKEGIARTSSNQLSSSHEHQEGMVPEVIPTAYASHSAVAADFSEKDTNWGSRKGSSSSASIVSSGDEMERPATETFKREDEYGIFQNIGEKTSVLTRQESVKSQLSEDAHGRTGESLRSLVADHTTIVVHKEVTTEATEEKETTVTEVKNNMDTETVSTNSFYTQLLAATDASTPTLDLDSSTPGLRDDTEVTVTPVTDHGVTSEPKDFLSVLDDINIETDITSRFLRRSSRLSGTFTPDRRQSKDIRSDLDDAAVARDPVTEATLSSTSFILADYQARDAAYTTQVGNHGSANDFSVANQFMDTDITLSDFVDEQKKETVENTVVDHNESLCVATNDEMHTTFEKASQEFAKIKDVDTDLNIHYDTIADDKSRNIATGEMIHSNVRKTEENQIDLFGLSEETDAAISSRHDIELDSQSIHEVTTEVVQPNDNVSEVKFDNKTTSLYVNGDFSSLSGQTDVNKYDKEGQIDAIRVDNSLQSEYVNDLVYQSAGELTTEETASGGTDFGVGQNIHHVHSYVNNVIRHSVDTVSTEELNTSSHANDWEVDVRQDKHQVHTYVDDITQQFDTISTEDMDRSSDTSDRKADVKEDKHHVHSFVNDIIRHSVGSISTEEMDRSGHVNDWEVDVKEDKQQAHTYVDDITQQLDTASTEEMDRSGHVNDWEVDVKEDKHQVHTYVDDITQQFDTISTEYMDRSNDTSDRKADVKEDKHHVHSFVNDIIRHSVGSISTEEMNRSGHVNDWKVDVKEDKQQAHTYVDDITQQLDTASTEEMYRSDHVNDWEVDVKEDKHQVHSYVNDIIRHSVDTASTEEMDRSDHVNDWEVDVKEDKHQVHSYVNDIIRHSVDTASTEEMDRSGHVNDWKVDVKEDKQQAHKYVDDITQHVDTKRTEEMDRSVHVNDWEVDVKEDKHPAHTYVDDITQHLDTASTEDMYRSDHVNDWEVDVKEDKHQVHSYVNDIIRHSFDSVSTEDINSGNAATDWKVETDPTDTYKHEASSEMNVDTLEKVSHAHEFEMGSRFTSNEINDSLNVPFDESDVKRHIRVDLHTDTSARDEIIPSHQDNEFGDQTIYESVDQMEAVNSSSDVHLDFIEGNVPIEHGMHHASPNISGHYDDGFSTEIVTSGDYLELHDEKTSIEEYVGDIIHHSIDAVTTETTESKDASICVDQVTPSHIHVNHSADRDVDVPVTQTHVTAFDQHFDVDSTYVHTSTDHRYSNHGHSPQLDMVVSDAFQEAELADTALLPSSMYNSLEINADDNNKEGTHLAYEEIASTEVHLTNTASSGLHISNDELEARATDNEDPHHGIITGLQAASLHDSFHEPREELHRIDDEDDVISDKYMTFESRDSYTKDIFQHQAGDQNTDAIKREDYVFQINQQNEFSEASITEPAFESFHQPHVKVHPLTNMQDTDITTSKHLLVGGEESSKHHIIEVTGDTTELNIEDPRSEDLHTYNNAVTQLENAYGSHIREENRIESEDFLHGNKEKESLYLDTFTAAHVDTHKVDQAETAMDLDYEIRKQHQILSPKLSEDAENDKDLNFNPDTSSSSRSSVSSAHGNQVSDHRHTTRETTFNRDFFVRSRSSSDGGKRDLSRKNSVGVTAESSLLFPREDNENKSPAELQHTEHSHAVEEFNRSLDINSEHSISSRSSVSSRDDHQTSMTSHSFRLDNGVDTDKDILPSADSLLVADTGFHSNVQLGYEEESTDFRSAKASSQKDVIEDKGEFVSQDSFGFQDQPQRHAQESDADFKSVKQTKEEYIAMAGLSQTLRSTSNDEESAKQKQDESHLFSRDKFQALRSVFEKQQEAIHETSSFKGKRNSYKLGSGTSSTSESTHMGNWELNRQVSSASSAASNDKKDLSGHLTSAAQIDDYTSVESDSDRIITKWSESDNEHNPDMQEQVHRNTIINKKLSYDLQTRELRRGSAISSSSIHSASSEDSVKHIDMDTHLADNQGEGYSSNFRPDDHYPKNNLFSQKPGVMNLAQWNTQHTYANDGDYAQTKRRSSTSSNISSASQKDVVKPITADYDGSSYKEDYQELHSPRENDQSQLHDVGQGVLNPSFSDDSLTEDEEVDLRKRTDKTNSLSSSRSSSLEIEDHSLFSQEIIGRFSPSDDQKATYIQAPYDIDTANINSEKSSVKSQSTKRSSLGYADDSFSPSDKNFSFRENNQIMTNITEIPRDNVEPQFVSQSSDRGAAVRRHSSSGSEKEAKLIGAFLRSGASLDMSSRMSRQGSETDSAKSHLSAEPARQTDDTDVIQSKRRVSSSSDSTDSVKVDLSRRTGSIRSEISLTDAPENYADLISVADNNTQNHNFQSEEAFTVVSHNFSQSALERDSFTSHEARSKSPTYLSPEEEHDFRWRQGDSGSPVNVNETTVKSYVIKRSIANDVYEKPNEHLHESVFSNSQQGLTQNSPRDFYTNNSLVPETRATEATEMYSETQESVWQRPWQSSPFGMDSINQGVTSKKENLSLENDRGYRDTPGSHLAQGHGEKLYQIKRTGLDTSPIFPSLLSRDTSVQHTHMYTAARNDQDTYKGGYLSSHGLNDGSGYSSSYVPFIQNAEKENVLHVQSRAPHVVDTANSIEISPTSPGVYSANLHRNQLSPTEDRFQFSPITISTASHAVVGDKVGVHIDFSPPAVRHSPDNISSSSDEESNQQRFIVKNMHETSVMKSNFNNSSSDINFTKEEATTENTNGIINASGSLSPRTVVDGPIFRTYKSQRSHLSRSLSSDNSLASHREYNSDFSPTVHGVTVTNNEGDYQNDNLYRVHNVQSNAQEFRTTEAERGRSRNKNTDFSDTKIKTPRKQHHSPERFFKNPKLSLRQADYDSKGYSSDDEDGKQYRHVTRVYISGETPRSRSPSPSTRYRVSSKKSQNSWETTRGNTVQENNTRSDVSNGRTSSNLRNRSPEISDNDSESGFQGHQQRYKVIGTSDSSLDKHEVRAQSSPKLDRKHEKYYQETSITRTEAGQPSQLSNVPAAQQTHKSVVQVEVGNNYIAHKPGPEDALSSRYRIKRVRSADNLRDDGLSVYEDVQSSSDRKMWKTGRSRSTERYLSHGDGVDGGLEPSGVYDLPLDNNKMYVVNSTLSNSRDNHDKASASHSWHTSTIDINERSPRRTHNLDQSHHDHMNSQNYKTEKTVFISNTASPQPSTENRLHRTGEFVFHDHGQGTEITNSQGDHGHHHNAERFERINEDMAEPHILDYSRSTEDLSNDLRVLRGKILIKNRFDSSEFSEDDFDQNVNLFDTSFHTGKDNPVYSSDPDIAASLRREEERDLSKHVTQDITFETVDKLAQQYKAERQVQLSPGPQRKKPNLSSLLLSKLALVDSKDIRQTVDVEHHNEEVHGDIRFVHADGEQKESRGTYNFDSVNEKVELTLTQGKANVIIKVIAERVVPTNNEFNTWRKSQAIVTRQIEIDLQTNEQMKRLYKHVMTRTGKSGSLEGSSRLSSYNSASLSPQERELNSMETLKLFTQILDVAEQQSKRDHTDSGVRHDLGQIPASVMDMLY